MDSTLLIGTYSTEEAEQLLSKLFKVKIDFHIARIDTVNLTEEDMKHSEKRVKQLEDELRTILSKIKNGDHKRVALHAKLTIEFCPEYTGA